jgi:hypothetical protein
LATIWKQITLNEMSLYGADLETSAAYGLTGVTALALGLRAGSLMQGGYSFSDRLQVEARMLSFGSVVRWGLGAIALGYIFAGLSVLAGPARELLGNAAGVKYVGVFLIAFWCLLNKRHYGLLALIATFEIVMGMTGFFAEFKNSLLTLVVAVMAARPRLKATDMIAAALVAVVVLFVATFWTAIKVEYRSLINQGTGAQMVQVPLDDRLGFIVQAVTHLDDKMLVDGFDRLVSRHGYIEFLALVMQNVPEALPHEDGNLTLGVISHITMPRFIAPNKPPLPSDTEVMKKYTGLTYTWDENTSISIGNLGELYIDFGVTGGLLAEFLIGLMVALVYRILRDNRKCPAIISAGFCVMIVLPVAYFGTAYIKLIGSFVFTSALAIAMQRYVVPRIAASQGLPLVWAGPERQ